MLEEATGLANSFLKKFKKGANTFSSPASKIKKSSFRMSQNQELPQELPLTQPEEVVSTEIKDIELQDVEPSAPELPEDDIKVETVPFTNVVVDPNPVMETPRPQVAETVPSNPNLVRVNGNNRVFRCTRCKTFVSAQRPHTEADCNARLNRKNRENVSAPVSTEVISSSRKRRVDKQLLKNFRKLEKQNAAVTAAACSLSKKASMLLKKYKKSKKVQIPKQLTGFLEYVTKKCQ